MLTASGTLGGYVHIRFSLGARPAAVCVSLRRAVGAGSAAHGGRFCRIALLFETAKLAGKVCRIGGQRDGRFGACDDALGALNDLVERILVEFDALGVNVVGVFVDHQIHRPLHA